MLPHVVQCRMGAFFEDIAAFNCLPAAVAYQRECERANPHFAYRVINREEG